METKMNRSVLGVLAICASTYGAAVSAASVPGLPAEAGAMSGDDSYFSVDIMDSTAVEGALDFSVKLLEEFSFGGNFGLQAFGFNVDPTMETETTDNGSVVLSSTPLELSNLPDGWSVKTDQQMGGQGVFDIALWTEGNNRTDQLDFTLIGAGQDQIGDEFAAKVAGYFGMGHGKGGDNGNGVEPPQAVPLPAAAWLFISGIVGMLGVARRRNPAAVQSAA
ncbi:VPLPA-CTERM sorting domain-containing protein [Thiohalobacter thiocyanaticus]|uniref:VPLPA-CTERM sorting domain-containing protein n=1 Tax=Thiohalobacter thiocyanaticus TaxID=585455 RepID=A0A426QID6_9GAMM|nr:VPLPA-CTERM sorting domain-containing protein [Thiohalobacter thiocyanaticus]RRQ21505.1 VPLPA-CTERM sorting domain-containing protein [Thiohalobacter thiocyanaticus]